MNGRRTTLATISTATNWICASTSLMTMNEKKLTELRTFGSAAAAAAGGEGHRGSDVEGKANLWKYMFEPDSANALLFIPHDR